MVFWMIGDLAGAPLRALPWIVLAAVWCSPCAARAR
jgi:iron complex transport system permease protein